MKNGERTRRFSSVLLAVLLSIALLPAGVFAEDLPENDAQNDLQTQELQTPELQAQELQQETASEPSEDAGILQGAELIAQEGEHVHDLELVPGYKATCSAAGRKDYYHCKTSTCGKNFVDAAGTEEVAADESNIIIPIDPSAHDMETVAAVKATCVKSGRKAYYHCKICGKKFVDKEGKEEVAADESNIITPIDSKNGHDWDYAHGVISGDTITYSCKNGCGQKKTEEYHEPYNPGPQTTKFTLDGNKLQFKEKVVKKPLAELNDAKVDHVWIKGSKKYMTVYWNNTKKMQKVDGIFIMRRTGSSKTYKQVAKLQFKKYDHGVAYYEPKNSYKDKTAKKKNKAYRYIAIAYAVEDDYTYITHCSDWAEGQTSSSKLKNAYTAKKNKSSASLQYKGKTTFKVKFSKPKKTYNKKSIRWYSDNPKVATVSKGKVTAKAPGTTTIRARLSSGKDVTYSVSVVGAFKPGKSTIKCDIADESSITLYWSAAKKATSYDLYQSNDGLHWNKPIRVKGTTKKVTGLKKGHRYTFFVVARNDNGPYTALGDNSNVIYQKAVIKLRETAVSGFPSSKSLKSGSTLTVSLKVTAPEGRKASLQMKDGKKWYTKKTVTLPKGTGTVACKISFPNDWWDGTSYWRLVIPKNKTATAYTSGTLTVKATRRYQNPSSYVQISNSISKHGYSYYTSPVMVNSSSTKSDHIEAFIKTAAKYKGTAYVQSKSGSPGKGIDESGLVIQACYGAGVDLWPISPSTRPYNCVPKIMSAKLKHLTYQAAAEGSDNYPTLTRGDLVFFSTSKNGTAIHVAIYLGLGKLLHADPVKGSVCNSTIRTLEDQKGNYKYYVVGARRIFN